MVRRETMSDRQSNADFTDNASSKKSFAAKDTCNSNEHQQNTSITSVTTKKKVRLNIPVDAPTGRSKSVTSTAEAQAVPPASSSFTATLPSTGLDVLLIGRSDLCRPLAESMLSVTFDRTQSSATNNGGGKRNRSTGTGNKRRKRSRLGDNRGDSAIEALRRHLCRSSSSGDGSLDRVGSYGLADAVRARHVRLVDSLSNLTPSTTGSTSGDEESAAKSNGTDGDGNNDPRIDHAVIVVTPSDPLSSAKLQQNAASLHPDYAIGGRVTVVNVIDESDGGYGPAKVVCSDLKRILEQIERGSSSGNSSGGGSSNGRTATSTLFSAPVPVLQCNLSDVQSRLAVSRMILQRTKMGSRGCWGADDGLDDINVSASGSNGNRNIASNGANDAAADRELDTGTELIARGGISPLFFSSIL